MVVLGGFGLVVDDAGGVLWGMGEHAVGDELLVGAADGGGVDGIEAHFGRVSVWDEPVVVLSAGLSQGCLDLHPVVRGELWEMGDIIQIHCHGVVKIITRMLRQTIMKLSHSQQISTIHM